MQFNNDCGIIKLKVSSSVNAHGDIGAEPAGHLQYVLLIFQILLEVWMSILKWDCITTDNLNVLRDTELNGNMTYTKNHHVTVMEYIGITMVISFNILY